MYLNRRHGKWKKVITSCGDGLSVILAVTIIILVMLFLATFAVRFVDYVQIVQIDTKKPPLFITSPNFLSVALDSYVLATGFKNFNITNPKLIIGLKYLVPAYFRIGGNLADRLLFSTQVQNESSIAFYEMFYESIKHDYNLAPNYTMTGSEWLQLMGLVRATNLTAIFDLNALLRFKNGSWDYQNAEELIKFSNDHGLNLNWELGNEPNAYKHKFNEEVTSRQLAKDIIVLRQILDKYPIYKESLVVGPDVDRMVTKRNELYLEKVALYAGHVLDAITWHQYYVNGRTATPDDFMNYNIFDTLAVQIETIKKIIVNSVHIFKPIWLGETGSAYGGGAPNLSDTFIGTFMWVDKLGLAARMGVKVVVRQSIFFGNYALLDDNYDPNPDWWVSLLYKRLVGTEVLHHYFIGVPNVRLYVHCAKRQINETRAVTIFGVNLDNTTSKVRIEGLVPLEYDTDTTVFSYELTSDGSLFSKTVQLNGEVLNLLPNHSIPKIEPKVFNIFPYITMPPLSVVFWVVPCPNIRYCYTTY